MSAFIVSNECMQKVMHYLTKCRSFGVSSDPFFVFVGDPRVDRKAEIECANALFAMNAEAVNDRYAHHAPESAPTYAPGGLPVSKMASYKAIRSLLYQCSEGDVPEKALFKALERAAADLADSIIHDSAEYRAAAWG